MCNFLQTNDDGECRYTWTTVAIVWILLNCSPMWLCLLLKKKTKITSNEKFKPFLRTDIDTWSYVFTLFTHLFFWPRFFVVWGIQLSFATIAIFIMIGTD